MKKYYSRCLIFKFIIFTILLTFSIIINSCRKGDSPAAVDPDNNTLLIEKAKLWYNQQIKANVRINKVSHATLHPQALPNWDAYTITKTVTGEQLIIVKTEGPEVTNPKLGLTSSLVFTYKNGGIVSGKRIEAIGEPTYIKGQGMQLIQKYQDKQVPGFNKGAFILYDINHNPLESHTLLNGTINTSISAVIAPIPHKLQKNLSALSGKNLSVLSLKNDSLHNTKTSPGTQIAQTSTTIQTCTDWYLVTYDANTGKILNETYLYTTCTSIGDDNNPGGGGGPGGSDGIFGLNNSNSQIPDNNFDNYLAYAESQGWSFTDPVHGPFTYNGITYQGEFTYMYDANGDFQFAYFSPDSSTGLMPTGYEYNIGDGHSGPGSTTIDDGGLGDTPSFLPGPGKAAFTQPSGGDVGKGSATTISNSDIANAVLVDDGKTAIDPQKYISCFTDGKTAKGYKLTIYVDQPVPGSNTQWTSVLRNLPLHLMFTTSNGTFLDVGHTFVSFEKDNTDGTKVTQVMGFYPGKGPFLPGVASKGIIKDDSGHPYNVSYAINVTASQFNAALSGVVSDNANSAYILTNIQSGTEHNCTDAAISWIDDAGALFANPPATTRGIFNNTPGDFGQALAGVSGSSTVPGTAPQSHGPCN